MHKEPGPQKGASYPILRTLYAQYTKNQAIKNWLSFDYIVTSNFVQPYPILLTQYVQYTKNPAIKKWPLVELICAVYLEYIVTSYVVRP